MDFLEGWIRFFKTLFLIIGISGMGSSFFAEEGPVLFILGALLLAVSFGLEEALKKDVLEKLVVDSKPH